MAETAQAEDVPVLRLTMAKTVVKPIYLKSAVPFAFSALEQKGMITGLKLCIPGGNNKEFPPRICYVVKYSDRSFDYIPISDVQNGKYVMTTEG